MYLKLKISIILLCIMIFGAGSAVAGNLSSSWYVYQDLYEKSKAMLQTVEEKGSTETDAYKQALTNLIAVLESNRSGQDEVTSAMKNLQSEASKLKDKPEVASFQTQFDGLRTTTQQCSERNRNTDGMIAFAMPVGFKKTFGDFTIQMEMDSLRYIRGENIDGVDDDVTRVNAKVKMNMPFAVSSDQNNEVTLSGDIRLAGANQNSYIYLESSHDIPIVENKFSVEILPSLPTGKNELGMCSAKDEKTWVSFNCNGIQDMNLVGRFKFSQSFIYAASDQKKPDGTANVDAAKINKNQTSAQTSNTNGDAQTAAAGNTTADAQTASATTTSTSTTQQGPKVEDGTVYAYFTIHGGKFITSVCFSDSFKIQGCGDFVFQVQDAIVDLSDSLNVNGFKLPSGYWDENKEAGLPEEAWSGFYLKKLDVRFPRELDLNDSKDKSGRVTLESIIIDDYGFTGNIWLTDFIDKGNYDDKGNRKKDNSGLGFSVDTVGAQFWQGDFIKGLIAGQVNVPFLGEASEKDSVVNGSDLKFRGSLGFNPTNDHFTYNVSLRLEHENEFKVPFTKIASIKITAGELNVQNTDSTNDVIASFAIDGELSLKAKLAVTGVKFEELKFCNRKPNISVKGLGLTGNGGFTFGGLSIQLTEFMWRPGQGFVPKNADLKDQDVETVLELGARISLMPGKNSLSAEAGFNVHAVYDDSHWKYHKLTVRKICLNADFSVFKFDGCVEHFDDDPVFGRGYRGDIKLSIKPIELKIEAQACFGKVMKQDSTGLFQYWFAKASVEFGKTKIVLFPPCVMAKSFTGGAYHAMRGPSVLDNVGNPTKVHLADVADYVPDDKMGFGFIAGVGAYVGDPKAVTVNVELEINFNSNWGLNQIKLTGLCSVMTPLSKEDTTAKGNIAGWLGAEYNRPKKTFVAQAGVNIDFGEILKGDATMEIYTGPDGWHFYLGTNDNPTTIKFAKMFTARSYFMLGKIPAVLTPMNEIVADYFKVLHSKAQGEDAAVKEGKGIAFGLDVSAGASCKSKREIFYASFSANAGVDILIKQNDCGKTKWRVTGDTYVIANGEAGVTIGRKRAKRKNKEPKKVPIISGAIYSMLMGTLPAPAYATGVCGMRVQILFIRIPNLEFDFEIGDNKCM